MVRQLNMNKLTMKDYYIEDGKNIYGENMYGDSQTARIVVLFKEHKIGIVTFILSRFSEIQAVQLQLRMVASEHAEKEFKRDKLLSVL